MDSVLIAALFAAASPVAPVEDANALDIRCFSLMAQLAEEDDPRVRSLSRVAAQYFLGRIDAASPGFDPDSAAAVGSGERTELMRRCGDAMASGGRDFRSIGQALAPSGARPSA